jgi:hypothetical protein
MPAVRRETNKKAAQGIQQFINGDNTVGKVGWFATAHYPSESGGIPVALVAAVQEFGWPEHNIPPRLGMRETAQAMRGPWSEVAATVAKRCVNGQMTPEQAMEAIGLKAAGDIRKHIAGPIQPPLKVATVEARLRGKKIGRSVSITAAKPLVDTGELLDSLTNVVARDGGGA